MRIRAYRLERHMTQEQLAENIGRSVETVSNIERGVSVPNEGTLRRLARCLEISYEDLLLERASSESSARPIEFYRATELLKAMDQKKLKLAYSILRAIAES